MDNLSKTMNPITEMLENEISSLLQDIVEDPYYDSKDRPMNLAKSRGRRGRAYS